MSLIALALMSLAAAEPVYDTRVPRFGPVPELRELKARVAAVVRVSPDGEKSVRVGKLEWVERVAISEVVFSADPRPGSESDLWVRDPSGARVPVTVWWDEDVVRVASGPPTEPVAAPIPDDLEAWLDRALLGDWDPVGRAVVAEAVRGVHPDVRRRLEGLPFVRVAGPAPEVVARLGVPMSAVLQAVYIDDAASARIEVYDAALQATDRFSGTPDDPRPEAVRVVAHELAHAVAHRGNRGRMQLAREGTQKATELIAQHNALVIEMNALIDEHNARPDPGIGKKIEAIQRRVAELAAEVGTLDAEMTELVASVGPDRSSLLSKALNTVRPFEQSPTWYGRTSIEEHFAECYALFLTDPAALERAAPEIHAWFVDGAHRVLMKEGS